MACTDNIVTISDICNNRRENSLSGFDLMDAPEISTNNLASIAKEDYVSGFAMATNILRRSVIEVKNDFIGALQANNVMADIVHAVYDTSEFRPATIVDAADLNRGVTLYKVKKPGKLRKTKITKVQLYPLASAESAQLMLIDNGKQYNYNIQLVADQVNTFTLNHTVEGESARVLINQADIPFASAYVKCGTGCDGSMPNDCGYALGYDGSKDTRSKEGYGINIQFQCICDYEELLCDFDKSVIGELIYIKARYNILDEQYKSNRFNDWVVYDQEKMEGIRGELHAEYREKWNRLMQGFYETLKRYRDSCLDCKGVRWVVNL